MKYCKVLLFAFVFVGIPACALGQEANLIEFSARMSLGAIDHSNADPSVQSSDGESVLRHMRAYLRPGAEQWAVPAPSLISAFELQQELPHLSAIRPAAILQYPSSACDNATYAPAWWLPQDTERRRAAYFGTVARIACEFGLPTRLLDAVIVQESGYNFGAISSAGAMGMMQIMPGTARALGLNNPFDPIANTRAGARYLRQQLDRFGRVDLALAAYNAGPERRSLRAGYVPAIAETRNYVRTITTNWARLAQLNVDSTDSKIRGNAAITAVHASGYRSVELVRYDGLNAANPM